MRRGALGPQGATRAPGLIDRRSDDQGTDAMHAMHVAVLVKQVPQVDALELGGDGRLRRDAVALEMNPYCRRAVSQGVALARQFAGRCVVLTLGPPSAEDVLREAIASGADEGVHVVDPVFAGSDTLVTARALAAALRTVGPLDVVLLGRNSVDADTGQVGPQIAQLLDLPFAASARRMEIVDGSLVLGCEVDDGHKELRLVLPAVVSVAERLCQPAKASPEQRAAVPATRLRRLTASDLGPGPWGGPASPTAVGATQVLDVARRRLRPLGSTCEQVQATVALLQRWGVLAADGIGDRLPAGGPARIPSTVSSTATSTATTRGDARTERPPVVAEPPQPSMGRSVVVLAEPGRGDLVAGLLGQAHRLAASVGADVVVTGPDPGDPAALWQLGADRIVDIVGSTVEEDLARAFGAWCRKNPPWAVLAPGTLWGREVAARLAVSLDAGMVGDALALGVNDAGRLVCWKPALTGRVVAEVTTSSAVQVATVRPGSPSPPRPRVGDGAAVVETLEATGRGRVHLLDHRRDPAVGALSSARRVVGVGAGVAPDSYDTLRPLLEALDAQLAATRRVTDREWLPRARQVGITGHHLAPDLYVAVGVRGAFNHMAGVRGAGTIVAINVDPDAAVFEWADIALVGDWRCIVPALATAVRGATEPGDSANNGKGHELSP
ncbi:MAG: FAD-binding protein [Acidimicrobiales bacterium]